MKYSILLFFLLLNISPGSVTDCNAQQYDVKKYGAKGDGVTDDYKAILSAVNAINSKGTGKLHFPKGTYYIKPYHTKDNPVSDIEFKNCTGLQITGDNAIIRVNGKFNRAVDYKSEKHSYSKTSSVIPFLLKNCHKVSIEGLEVRGEVNLMTKTKGLTEFGGHLLSFNNCSNVEVKNTYIHHAQTDGIYITNKSSDFRFNNVRSSNNARQGMSIIDLHNARFENCLFEKTGFTDGKYGSHAPKAGVDIEPGPKQTVKDITFYKCSFIGNAGPQFVCSRPSRTSNISIDNSTLKAESGTYPYQLILNVKNLKITNSNLDLGKGSIYPVWGKHSGSDTQIINCTIKSSGKGIVAVTKDLQNKVLLQGNHLIYTGKSMTSYFPYLQMENLRFINNQIDMPSSSIKKGKITSLVQKAEMSSGNKFKTEQSKITPKVSYQGTKTVKDR